MNYGMTVTVGIPVEFRGIPVTRPSTPNPIPAMPLY